MEGKEERETAMRWAMRPPRSWPMMIVERGLLEVELVCVARAERMVVPARSLVYGSSSGGLLEYP